MKNRNTILGGIGVGLLILGVSCNLLSGLGKAPETPTPANIVDGASLPTPAPSGESAAPIVFETDFPLPDDVQNFSNLGTGEDAINFQTKMSVEEAVAFYREAFQKKGLSEDKLLATVEETTFSIVFRGDPNGKAVVVQGVDLGSGTININIRYEET